MFKPHSHPSYFELKAEQPGQYMELTPPIPSTTGTAKPSILRQDANATDHFGYEERLLDGKTPP